MNARQQTTLIAGDRVIYTMRRSKRAKQVLLHIDGGGQIEVVIPRWVSWGVAEQFVRAKHDWLQRHRQKQRQHRRILSLEDGSRLPWLGAHITLRVERDQYRRRATILLQDTILRVVLPPRASGRQVVEKWYRTQASRIFTEAAQAVAVSLPVQIGRVVVGNHRTQWGSCSAQGRLSFNWRLLLGPRWVMEYVVVHEVAHLVHHNHSRKYWALVAQLFPRYEEARAWLKHNAGQLHW